MISNLFSVSNVPDATHVSSTDARPPAGVGASEIAVTASEAGSAAPPTYVTYPIMWVDSKVDVQMKLPVLPSQSSEGKGATVVLTRGQHADAPPMFEHLLQTDDEE